MPKQIVEFGRRKCDPRCVYTDRTHNYWLMRIEKQEEQRLDDEEFLESQQRQKQKLELIKDVLAGLHPVSESIWWYADEMRFIRKLSQRDYERIEHLAKEQMERERQEQELERKREVLMELWEKWGDNIPHSRTRRSRKKGMR